MQRELLAAAKERVQRAAELKEREELLFFKQKTAYEILRSDWSSDVCSSD
eukprot:COSAG04_NODE_32469_length_251_cov_0.500000_1_plen_49_part_10